MGSGVRTNAKRLMYAVNADVYRHIAQVPLLSYSFFSPRHVPVQARREDGHRPLILLHGLGGSRGDLLPLEWYLRLFGRRRIYRVGLRGRSLVKMSRSVARAVRRVMSVNECQQVDIVGYSLGGIVARYAIEAHGLAPFVGTLVTMGTPHHGTHQAHLLNTELVRSLRPRSAELEHLAKADWPKGVRGVTFWSKNDLFIQPPEAAAVDGTEQVDMSPFTHFSYLIDPRSWAAVRTALAG